MTGERASWTPLERGTGLVIGLADVPGPPPSHFASARAALEDVVREALLRPPCVVSFSGGRDSSAVLAVAAYVARRDGLPLPVPVSLTFPRCESSREDEWEEIVVRHLKLPDWERPTFDDELDIVGPVASRVLRAHGVHWPFNAFFHVPIFGLAHGGTVLSGVGGDEVFSTAWAWHRENAVLRRRSRPKPLDLVRVGIAVAPTPIRAAFLTFRERSLPVMRRPPWLRPDAHRAVMAAYRDVRAHESLSFRHGVRCVLWRLRSRVLGMQSLLRLAADHGAAYNAPLFDGRFLSALAAQRGWRMFESRTAAMDELFGDLLPPQIRDRRTKAWFDTAFFNRHARAFVAEWDGRGVDRDYVDPEELRRAWLQDEEPDARTYGLLQAAWLADRS